MATFAPEARIVATASATHPEWVELDENGHPVLDEQGEPVVREGHEKP